MGIFNVDSKAWKVKILRWLRGANERPLDGTLVGILLLTITWKLWMRHCMTRMEDTKENFHSLWSSIRFWTTKILEGLNCHISKKHHHLLEEFNVETKIAKRGSLVELLGKNHRWIRLNSMQMVLVEVTRTLVGVVVSLETTGVGLLRPSQRSLGLGLTMRLDFKLCSVEFDCVKSLTIVL